MEAEGNGMARASIDARIAALYPGDVDWRDARGRLHVAAIHAGTGHVLAIGPDAPRSPTDRFVLGFARARVDVILTTGSILRSEPDLVHTYGATDEDTAALGAWRRERLGLASPPRLLVLSATGDFPVDHPALRGATGWIWTSEAGRARLGAGPAGFECVVPEAASADGSGLEAALAFVEAQAGVASCAIEAGPSTAAALYATGAVDELLLSRFDGALADGARGPAFVSPEAIARRFGAPRSEVVVEEASGPWRFERFRAARGAER